MEDRKEFFVLHLEPMGSLIARLSVRDANLFRDSIFLVSIVSYKLVSIINNYIKNKK